MNDIVDRLKERAKNAREENTATALGDALHFEEAAATIERLESLVWKQDTHRKVQWAEMSPDVYAGENFDEIKPRWWAEADGDMDGDFIAVLKLAAHTFPPGTKVVISEPVCPSCGDLREPVFPRPKEGEPLYSGPCSCGFDWDAWTLDEYS